jgi:translation elongation factor EF-G
MPEGFETYLLSIPEDVVGDVMGELSVRGGWICHMKNDTGVFEVRAEMPDGSMTDFKSWLAKTTLNRGSVRRID